MASQALGCPPIPTKPLLPQTTSDVKHFHVQANTATHKGNTRTLSPLTHKHSLKQTETWRGAVHCLFNAFHSFLVKLQQQSLNSLHHPLLVNDLQFESQFPFPVLEEPEPLGGPHPLGLNSEGGGEVQAPLTSPAPGGCNPLVQGWGGISEEVPCERE